MFFFVVFLYCVFVYILCLDKLYVIDFLSIIINEIDRVVLIKEIVSNLLLNVFWYNGLELLLI